ncbi:MAG: hypothetical protein WAT78_03355, partial [Rhizobiaceae bacterium]
EWSAAYNADPGSEKGKLLPFLLEPTELNPLARQIVYTNLIGLNAEERKKAVLKAIAYKPRKRTKAELGKILQDAVTPIPAAEQHGGKTQIGIAANPLADTPLSNSDLLELPGLQVEISEAIMEALPGNAPKVISSCLVRYKTHLATRKFRPHTDTLRGFASPIQHEFDSSEFAMWGAGLDDLLKTFFNKHALLITHFPLPLERERALAETPIDEVRAVGKALSEPIENAVTALEALSDHGMTSEDFDNFISGIRVEAKEMAGTTPTQADAMAPTTKVTPKRRFVLVTIGFLERTYAFIGATASIAATPQGMAALAALRQAIDKLLGLII